MNSFRYLLLALIFHLTTEPFYAQSVLTIEPNHDCTGMAFNNFMVELEHDFPVHFFFKKEWVQSLHIRNGKTGTTLGDILTATLYSSDLTFILLPPDNVVIIPEGYSYFATEKTIGFFKQVGNPLEKGKYTLNEVKGQVHFGKTGEPLPGAVITDKKNQTHTTSDMKGNFTLKLPGGMNHLQFTFMGLETLDLDVDVFSPGTLDVELMEAPIAIEGVTITAEGGKNNVERTQMGMVHLDIKNISKLPVLMGEADIIKSMTLLPGVQTAGEMASGFNVRGGNTDQNLILINDAPVYGTTHLFGLFSTLIPGAVSSVNLHKGTQPSQFGSRAASVMEIKLKTPDTTKIKGKAGIGILNSSLFIEGPVFNKKWLFFVGGRTTYSNWMLKQIPDLDIRRSKAQFYDVMGKLEYRMNQSNTMSLFTYLCADNFTYSTKNDYHYQSLIGGLNHTGSINQWLSVHNSLSYSQYKNETGYTDEAYPSYRIESGIEQLNLRTEWNLHLQKQEWLAGAEAIGYYICPGKQQKYNDDSEAVTANLDNEKAFEGAIFIQDNVKITDRFGFSAGLRYSVYSKLGEATVYKYHEGQPINENTVSDTLFFSTNEWVKPYMGFEPRLGIRFTINESSSVKAGFNIARQYQHLISNTATATPSDYWKSADNTIKPLVSRQFSVGYFKNFMGHILETSVEGYYKTGSHVLEYKNGAVLSMNPAIERDVIDAQSKSYGLEFMLRKNVGKLTGWLSYTLSKSVVKADGAFAEEKINNGKYFPSYTDRLHDLTLSANYQLTRRWTFGGNFILSGGRPVTLPEKKYLIRNLEIVEYSDRNEYRLPAYHRLDLSITYEGFLNKTQRVHPSFTFSVYNVYSHKNIYSVYYKQDKPTIENNYQKFALYQLSIIGVPIPSLTLNLSF